MILIILISIAIIYAILYALVRAGGGADWHIEACEKEYHAKTENEIGIPPLKRA